MKDIAGFEDFQDDDLGPVSANLPKASSRFEKRAPTDRAEQLFSEPCSKCRGNGYIGAYAFRERGICYQCNGKGTLTFKTPKAVRESNRAKAADRKVRKADENLADFEAQHPHIAAWWKDSDFEFAVSMREAVRKFGSLTEKQFSSSDRCAKSDAMRKAAHKQSLSSRPDVDASAIQDAFAKASQGKHNPKLRLATDDVKIVVSMAPASGSNAGALYVKERGGNEAYLGKIMNGKFLRSRDCTDSQEKGIVAAASDPSSAAKAYGLKFGECSVCGRTLTDPVSIANGIGPICETGFGF